MAGIARSAANDGATARQAPSRPTARRAVLGALIFGAATLGVPVPASATTRGRAGRGTGGGVAGGSGHGADRSAPPAPGSERRADRAPRAVRFAGTVVDWYYGLPLGPGVEVHIWSQEARSATVTHHGFVLTEAGGAFSVRLAAGPRYQFRAYAGGAYGAPSGWIRTDDRRERVDLVW